MTIDKRIAFAKKAFKTKYARRDPAQMGITAAYQRASLYTPGGNNQDIREEWASQLRRITKKYAKQQSKETFFKDVMALAKHMNERFPNRFRNGKNGYKEVFRIAHAQKSLSVCLKHLWIQNEPNFAIPPVCPIDGKMLKYVHNQDSWTKVNSFKDENGVRGYFSHLDLMEKAARAEGFKSSPEWEVVVWYELTKNNGNLNSQSNKKNKDKKKDISKYEIKTAEVTPLTHGLTLRKRYVLYGYSVPFEGKNYYLFVGEKPTFHYLELLTEKSSERIEECSLLHELESKGFNKNGDDYIYKRLKPYDEGEAKRLLDEIVKKMTSDNAESTD